MSKLASVIKPPQSWRWPIKLAYALVAGLPILSICALIFWWLISVPVRAAVNDRTIAVMRSELKSGMTRSDCYTWLRRHHLTAVNGAYSHWRTIGNNAWQRVDDGAWPQPDMPRPKPIIESPGIEAPENPSHPEVYITLNAGWTGACGALITEKITFDENDRIDRRTFNKNPSWTCL